MGLVKCYTISCNGGIVHPIVYPTVYGGPGAGLSVVLMLEH
jgi:hypothetical protein